MSKPSEGIGEASGTDPASLDLDATLEERVARVLHPTSIFTVPDYPFQFPYFAQDLTNSMATCDKERPGFDKRDAGFLGAHLRACAQN